MENSKNKNIVLECKNISKHFGGIQALKNVSFNLYSSEILAVVGANGAGKSTLMKIIAGVYKPDSGEIIIDGRRIESYNVSSIRNIGIEMVYQDLALVKNMSAPYNLFIGRIPTKLGFIVDRKKMEGKTKSVYEKLGITTLKNVWNETNNLSGGQQQALAIGRAVAWGRKVIILDEPTAALGVSESEQVIKLIQNLRDQGSSIILISHNMDHVFRLADRILVIRNGLSVAELEKAEVTVEELVQVITAG